MTCYGLSNGASALTATGGTSPYTYQWMPSGGTNATATGLSAGNYSVVVTDNLGNSVTATTSISQPAAITATIISTQGSCISNGSATVAATGGTPPYTYTWVPTGGTNATGIGLSVGSYTVLVTDNNGCVQTAGATITQPPPPTVTISGTDSVCYGNTDYLCATVTGGASPYTYLWAPSGATTSCATVYPASTTTYTVLIKDANGCSQVGMFTVIMKRPPTVTISPSRTSICPGQSVTLTATATNYTGTFTWQPGSMTGSSITVSPSATTTYSVIVYDSCSTGTAAISTVDVNPSPIVDIGFDVSAGCAPLCVQCRGFATISSGRISEWTWTLGNGDTSHAQNPIFCYPDSGSYTVSFTATSDSGCSSTLTVPGAISVYSHPKAAFTFSPQPDTNLSPIQFTDMSTDKYGIAYRLWNFGDGDTLSTQQNPSHKYSDTGTYCPTLVVYNIHGCTDTVTNCLTIAPAPKENEKPGFNLYPTIGYGVFTLKWYSNQVQTEVINLSITDELGQEVYANQILSFSGAHSEQLNLENLTSAVYFLRINSNTAKTVIKFEVLHHK